MKIIDPTEAIAVPHPTSLFFSPPGIGKTTLSNMTRRPLTLDFDRGAHRAQNRKHVAQPEGWEDIETMLEAGKVGERPLTEFSTVVLDTVGRCLDMLAIDIMVKNPKRSASGSLDQKGWGLLKDKFHLFLARLKQLDKDVVMLAHAREKDDGDTIIQRPDIQGGSYGEVMKSADLVGFLYVHGKDRILDFSPTDRWVGKNPAQWSPFKVPHFGKEPEFLSGLIDQARAALGKVSEESAKAAAEVERWRGLVEMVTSVEEANGALKQIEDAPLPVVKAQAKALLWERVKAMEFTWDAKGKTFVAPKPKAPEVPAEAPVSA